MPVIVVISRRSTKRPCWLPCQECGYPCMLVREHIQETAGDSSVPGRYPGIFLVRVNRERCITSAIRWIEKRYDLPAWYEPWYYTSQSFDRDSTVFSWVMTQTSWTLEPFGKHFIVLEGESCHLLSSIGTLNSMILSRVLCDEGICIATQVLLLDALWNDPCCMQRN